MYKMLQLIKNYENWYTRLLEYRLIKSGTITYRIRNGIKLRVESNTADTGILEEIWFKKSYNPFGFEIKPGDIIIDIGAHKGFFSIFAAMNPNVKIFCFEPEPKNYKFLEENIKINKIKNIMAFKEGVAGKKQMRKFYVSTHPGGHSLYMDDIGHKITKIRCTTLKEIFKINNIKRCNFLKIDAEGAEYEIILNTPKDILKKIDKISLEYHNINEYKLKNLMDYLTKIGFEIRLGRRSLYKQKLYAKLPL